MRVPTFERKVGEIFPVDGIRYIVVAGTKCERCDLRDLARDHCACMRLDVAERRGRCGNRTRKDGGVVFRIHRADRTDT